MECGSQRSRFMARHAPFIRRSTRLREAAPAWQASFAEAKRKSCLRDLPTPTEAGFAKAGAAPA